MLLSQQQFCHFRTMDSSSHSQRQESQLSETMTFPATPHKTCIKLPNNSLSLLLFCLCPCLHLSCKRNWYPLLFFLIFFLFMKLLNVQATGNVCHYGESWRDSKCLSQYLFAALFHASQPGSAINPEHPNVPADPSPHRAPLLATAVHWHASQTAD